MKALPNLRVVGVTILLMLGGRMGPKFSPALSPRSVVLLAAGEMDATGVPIRLLNFLRQESNKPILFMLDL